MLDFIAKYKNYLIAGAVVGTVTGVISRYAHKAQTEELKASIAKMRAEGK